MEALTERARHTPGPWFVNGPYHIQANTPDITPVIVAVASQLRHGDVEVRSANARLLAAAPELLKALATIVKMSERPLGECDYPQPGDKPNQHGGRWAYRHEEMGAIARAAIARTRNPYDKKV